MPSPCEVVPEQVPIMVMDGPRAFAPARSMPIRLIPALAGGAFAGTLLVVLGCTPLFQPASARAGSAAAQQPTIVKATGEAGAANASLVIADGSASSTSARSKSSASTGSGVAPIAAASSTRGGVANAQPDAVAEASHGFSIHSDPAQADLDASSPRPERVALQGIMSGQSKKAALMDGVLYREGDQFGSSRWPWTVAMIDHASVRIEKAFGDRTCGVTIRFQNDRARASASP